MFVASFFLSTLKKKKKKDKKWGSFTFIQPAFKLLLHQKIKVEQRAKR